jgi:hypothetical protein
MTRHWLITDRGDPDTRALVDGAEYGLRPHYSRQTPGAVQWCRNGETLVFITRDGFSLWAIHRPSPGANNDKGTPILRQDKRAAWECTLFRNENLLRKMRRSKPRFLLSSTLIREAVALTCAIWGPAPADGIITFVKPSGLTPGRSSTPGACYLAAGWTTDRPASDGKPCFRAPPLDIVPDWYAWDFKGDRGGAVRFRLTGEDPRRPNKPVREDTQLPLLGVLP